MIYSSWSDVKTGNDIVCEALLQGDYSLLFSNEYECGPCFRASYSKLGSKITLHVLDTHILLYELFLDN